MSLIKIAAALGTARWRGAGRVLHIVLVEPEIPPNCGNIARTCAATGSRLHLVEPLGFDVSDRAVKRAGLPLAFRERHRDRCVRLPMVSGARSLNLANSAAILVYEALRQNGFPGLTGTGEMA